MLECVRKLIVSHSCHRFTLIQHSTQAKKGKYYSRFLVGFGLSGPLRQYFSLYQAVSQREGERNEK